MISEENNKLNTFYFECTTMKGLYETLESCQQENQKRLLSLNIQKDGDLYSCIALTNPTEVVITGGDGRDTAVVNSLGQLIVAVRW